MDAFLNFRHLRALTEVARLGGVRAAAANVNMSQPAISQAIGKLERAAGERLFARGMGMTPTAAGHTLIRRVGRALAYLEAGAKGAGLERFATTTQLRALLEVVDCGGYAPAARRLGVTQPNISRALAALEKTVGYKLFHALPTGARPVPATSVLARHVGLAFREMEQAADELRELRGLRDGVVAVGALPLSRAWIVPTAVTQLLTRHPDARVRILDGSYAELVARLRNGQVDFIIGALRMPLPDHEFAQEELFSEPLSIVVRRGHPALRHGAIDAQRLPDLEWIVPNEQTPARVQFAAFFQKHGLPPPRRMIECSSLVATRGLLLQSDRAALLSASQVHYEMRAGDLAVAEAALAGTSRAIGICSRADWSPTRLQRALIALVRRVARRRGAP